MSAHNDSHLKFDKDAENTHWSRDSIQQMVLEEVDVQMYMNEIRLMTIALYQNQF